MWLQDFRYYFSVTGDEGGLFSVEFEFCPAAAPARRLSPEQEKAAVRGEFSALDALLGRALQSGLLRKAKKEPTLSDSPSGSQVGFVYRQGKSITRTASPKCHLHKTNRQAPATLQLELNLGHKINLSLFEKVMALPDLQVSEKAQHTVRQMRAALETKERDALDPMRFLEDPGA